MRETARQLRDVREDLTVTLATLDPRETPQAAQEAMSDAHHYLTKAMVALETGKAPR